MNKVQYCKTIETVWIIRKILSRTHVSALWMITRSQQWLLSVEEHFQQMEKQCKYPQLVLKSKNYRRLDRLQWKGGRRWGQSDRGCVKLGTPQEGVWEKDTEVTVRKQRGCMHFIIMTNHRSHLLTTPHLSYYNYWFWKLVLSYFQLKL